MMCARPLDRWFGMVERKAEPKNLLLARRRPELFLELMNVGKVNVMLIDDELIKFHDAELRRDGVEAVLHQRVVSELLFKRRQRGR